VHVQLNVAAIVDDLPIVVVEADQLPPVVIEDEVPVAQHDVAPMVPGLVVGDPQIGVQPPVVVYGNDFQNGVQPVHPDALAIVPYQPPVLPQQDFVVGHVHVDYGPPLPPEMAWRRTFDTLLGRCSALHVPKQVFQASFGPLVLSKRSWFLAFERVN